MLKKRTGQIFQIRQKLPISNNLSVEHKKDLTPLHQAKNGHNHSQESQCQRKAKSLSAPIHCSTMLNPSIVESFSRKGELCRDLRSSRKSTMQRSTARFPQVNAKP
jgi:cytochrome c-type biogenesis protein CcmH/NrfF